MHKPIRNRPRSIRLLRLARRCGELRGQSGQALTEFVLVAPIVLALLFGIAEFGLALNATNDETHIANEVARYAAVNQNPGAESGGRSSLQAWGKQQADESGEKSGTLCIRFPTGRATVGEPVEVEFTSTKAWGEILWKPLRGNPVQFATTRLVGKAIMRLEAPPTTFEAGCA
jgi:hypothetical protein